MSGLSVAAGKKVLLNSGYQIPLIGLGTYLITDAREVHNALDYAFSSGYRLIDTATVYRNEKEIGDALKVLLPKHNLSREDVFIVSKFIPEARDEDFVVKTIEASLNKLQLDYIDLYLIHWPAAKGIPMQSPEHPKYRDIAWKGLVSAQKKGILRSIGVSNYLEKHLKELQENSHGILPAANQVEWHPHYHSPDDLLDYCQKQNIFFQAYSSFGGGKGALTLDPIVQSIAKKLGKTSSQVLLRWATQQNIGVIPKARSQQHIQDNIALDFIIPEEDMKALSNMEYREKYSWDPTTIV
ncbi:uncharacterized oxidoreductase MSMEG_2408/MSMEI_2347-like [Phlebotomus papatasi]|uniref:uncharacterized oxidoreductase MSMEG_2408/MSMEI_2347-like n=1 Tax=Phlebotomus papatasi TaxID=29031 RepID=UPI002483599C|nr:uncharacterized oxidoreductase MSMEG_2408/MSMEI_2347-like [Phlebotomus papatasi]